MLTSTGQLPVLPTSVYTEQPTKSARDNPRVDSSIVLYVYYLPDYESFQRKLEPMSPIYGGGGVDCYIGEQGERTFFELKEVTALV